MTTSKRFGKPARHYEPWTEWEKAFVAARPDWDNQRLGQILGRRTKAIKCERARQSRRVQEEAEESSP